MLFGKQWDVTFDIQVVGGEGLGDEFRDQTRHADNQRAMVFVGW